MGVRLPPPASRAGVVQPADTPSSEGGRCEFKSHLPYQSRRPSARVAQTAEAALSKRVSVRVRLPPRASRARVAQAGRGGGLKPRRLRVRVSPRASAQGGVCKWTKRPVLQTGALRGFAGSSPAAPARTFHVGRSSTGRAPRCDRGGYGFEPRRPTLLRHTGR